MCKTMDARDRDRLWELLKPCTVARHDAYMERKDYLPYPGTEEAVAYFDVWASSQEEFLVKMREIHEREKSIFFWFKPMYDFVEVTD